MGERAASAASASSWASVTSEGRKAATSSTRALVSSSATATSRPSVSASARWRSSRRIAERRGPWATERSQAQAARCMRNRPVAESSASGRASPSSGASASAYSSSGAISVSGASASIHAQAGGAPSVSGQRPVTTSHFAGSRSSAMRAIRVDFPAPGSPLISTTPASAVAARAAASVISASSRSRPTNSGPAGSVHDSAGGAGTITGDGLGRFGRAGGGVQQVEPLRQHRVLQFGQRRAGVEPQFVDQGGAGPAQRRERVGLPPAAPQGQRQQPPPLLTQGFAPRQHLSRRYGIGRWRRPQGRLHQQFLRDQAQLGQPGGFGDGPLLVGELGEGRALPVAQGVAQQGAGGGGVPRAQVAGLTGGALEPPGVDGLGVQPDGVTGGGADQHRGGGARRAAGFEEAAQVGHIGLQRGDGLGRGLPAPQILDHAVDGDHVSACGDQKSEDGTLPRSAEEHGTPVDVRFERSKDPHANSHGAMVYTQNIPRDLQAVWRTFNA